MRSTTPASTTRPPHSGTSRRSWVRGNHAGLGTGHRWVIVDGLLGHLVGEPASQRLGQSRDERDHTVTVALDLEGGEGVGPRVVDDPGRDPLAEQRVHQAPPGQLHRGHPRGRSARDQMGLAQTGPG